MYIEQKPNRKIKRHTNKATKTEENTSSTLLNCACVPKKKKFTREKKLSAQRRRSKKSKRKCLYFISGFKLNAPLFFFRIHFFSPRFFLSLLFSLLSIYIYIFKMFSKRSSFSPERKIKQLKKKEWKRGKGSRSHSVPTSVFYLFPPVRLICSHDNATAAILL